MCICVSHSVMFNSATPRTTAHQAPLSMGFSRQEYWSRLPFPSPGDLSKSGIEPQVSCIAGWFFTVWGTREFYISLNLRFSVKLWLPRWLSGKESACQCRRYKRCRFDPLVRKIPWRRKWQSSILAWKIPWTGKPGGLQSLGVSELDMTEQLTLLFHFKRNTSQKAKKKWNKRSQ